MVFSGVVNYKSANTSFFDPSGFDIGTGRKSGEGWA